MGKLNQTQSSPTFRKSEFLHTVDSKQKLRVKIEATMLEKEMMGEILNQNKV